MQTYLAEKTKTLQQELECFRCTEKDSEKMFGTIRKLPKIADFFKTLHKFHRKLLHLLEKE